MAREIELKLQVAPAELARLRRFRDVLAEGETAGPPVRRKLVSIYYDTADRRLREAGIALRVRRSGRQTVQTIKAAGRASAGLANYAECNTPLGHHAMEPDLAQVADDALRKAVISACDGAALVPLFSTEFQRTTFLVTDLDGGVIEVAFDQGAVAAGRRRAPLSEIELELKAGGTDRLFGLARRIAAGTSARLRSDTKAARGFRLLERRHPRAVKAGDIAVPADATVEQAFQAIVRGCLAHLVANEPAVSDRRDAEGVHQMRVALRRFRSAIKLFGDLVRSDETARVAEQAQALGRLLGAARDFDVFENEAYGPVAATFPDDAAAFRHLIGPIRRRRAAAYREVLAYLASPAYTAFLLDAGEWAEACRWRRDGDADQEAGLAAGARDFARATLAAGHRKLCKAGRHPDRLEPEARHDLRKRLKRYRYAVEFFAPTLTGSVRPMIRRLARLQEALGVLNDGRTARSLLARPPRRNPDGFDWAAGAIAGWHAHAAAGHLAKTAKLWKRFRKDEAFWRD